MGARVRVGVIAIWLVLCKPVFVFAQSAAADSIGAITSALRASQFDRAIELLQPELQRDRKNKQLWVLDGIALSGKGNKKEALAAFQQALGIAPDYLPALEGAAQIEYEIGAKDAEPLLQRILKLHSSDATSHAMLAVLAYRRKDCTAAVSHFEQSGALVESQAGALQQYGDCLLRLRKTDEAIAVLTRALEQPNSDPGVRSQLASAQMMAERPKNAIATLQPLLDANTKDEDVLNLAVSAYERDGNTPEAVRILRQAIIADPHNVNLYIDFTNLCIDHQSFQVGVDMVNVGLRAEPNAAPLYVARGVLYVELAQFDKAEADFEKADAINPREAIGSAAAGLEAVQENDPERALATVEAKLAKKPNDAYLLYLEADILTERGSTLGSAGFQKAMSSAKKAVELRPSLTPARDVLAKLYIQAGQNNAAIEQSRKALSTDPKDQTALYHLIQALRKSGQTNEIPNLLKQLADLRMADTKEEAKRNSYKLVEKNSAPEKAQP